MRTSFRRLAMVAALAVTIVMIAPPARAAFPNQGNRVLYVRAPSAPATPLRGEAAPNDLFSIKNSGDDRRRVTDSPKVNEFGGSYSPDGSHIVYWGQTLDGFQVLRANADGTGRTTLTNNPVSANPSWSRNGARIVYVKYTGPVAPQLGGPFAEGSRGVATTELMIMDADGTGKHSILNGTIYAPGWSPSAPEIAYSAPVGSDVFIYLISPEGGEPLLLCCKGGGTAVFADWSPDGRRLLFMYTPPAAGPASTQLFTIRRNSTDVVPVTDESYQFTLPRYSDDGERVIFAKDTGGGNLDLFSIRSDGSGGKKRLTDTPGQDEWLNYLVA